LTIGKNTTLEEFINAYSIKQIQGTVKTQHLPQHFKGISGGAIWTLSGFVLAACADTDGSGGTVALSGSGASLGDPNSGSNPVDPVNPGSGNSGGSNPAPANPGSGGGNPVDPPVNPVDPPVNPNLPVDDDKLPPTGRAFSLESSNFNGGTGVDLVIASAGANGQGGNDVIFGSTANQIFIGGADDDAIFGEGGSDNISGGLGNDLLVAGVFHTDELNAYRMAQTRFDLQIDFFSLPEITDGRSTLNGDNGNDLIFAYAKATASSPHLITGGASSGQTTGDNDLIIAHSNSNISGGGGNDIFWLRPVEAGDRFTITDFTAGDRFLIVTDANPTTVSEILIAARWAATSAQDLDNDGQSDDLLINGVATLGDMANQQYRIYLLNTASLTTDDFLIMTEAETEAYIATFDAAGPDIL
jgi:Ca2+-binding RTX toxin-like protein